ncbi:peptidoglycan editing factor PgeF [Bdellovibrio sp. BCCA]|uniref:peptidoglycan editing factor PgeF n=1 Tax=Bdellovibrio sp. BCCA TaxID=3136281 RepID=UPI0030F0C45A
MNLEQTQFGYEMRTPHITVFMGGVQSQLPQLTPAYPDYKLVRVKQIHCDAVVETTNPEQDYQVIADAHFTREKNLALCVITADCVPVFLYDHPTGMIAGIHAGWRGVAARIIPKTIQKLVSEGAVANRLSVIIGPHIQKQSFEVGIDVRDQILSSLGPLSPAERNIYAESLSPTKALVDLNQVVRTQLQQEGVELDNVFALHIDTVTDPLFHSHRRDKEKAGRQISFICRTS